MSRKRLYDPTIYCGIYFLILGDEIVYVGQSVDVLGRINTHYREGQKQFDSYSFVKVPAEDLCNQEAKYIAEINPEYNRTMLPGCGYFSLKQWAGKLGVSHLTISDFISHTGFIHNKKWYSEAELSPVIEYVELRLKERLSKRYPGKPHVSLDYRDVNDFMLTIQTR